MMTIKELLELVKPEERGEIMDKILETSKVKKEELLDSGSIQVVIWNIMLQNAMNSIIWAISIRVLI